MKKLITTLIICIFTTSWALAGGLDTQLKQTELSENLIASGLSLENVLAVLSAQSGIHILAVPEVAQMKINIKLEAKQTLVQALAQLCSSYQLNYKLNSKKNAIIVFKGSYYERPLRPALSSVPVKIRTEYQESHMYTTGAYQPNLQYNTEEYKRVYDNNYQAVLTSPVSTFSIDVDTASYSNIRRFINMGKLPPPDAVRTEEMINYFTYDYPQPKGGQPFSVTTEVAMCPWQSQHQLALISLQGKNLKFAEVPASNLVFLIDVSGSMNYPNKLPLLKTAFKLLVKQLRPQDTVSIVVYAGKAGLVLKPTSGSQKTKIIKAIESLQAGGSTAGGEGIKLAYKIAKDSFVQGGNNRVILATDGDFNVGVSSEGALARLIEERHEDGILLSVLGFGMGNIKDNKMETLADKGNGNYAYIDNVLEAQKVMVGQLAGTLYTIAKDVKIQVEFNPAKVKYYRLIGYENRVLNNSDFNDDKKDAGDMGAGHSVTALYEIIPAGSDETVLTTNPLAYQRGTVIPSEDVLQVSVRYKRTDENTSTLLRKRVGSSDISNHPSANFKFAAAVAEYGMVLRNSEFKGGADYGEIIKLAKEAIGKDSDGLRAEFIRLVEISQLLDENFIGINP